MKPRPITFESEIYQVGKLISDTATSQLYEGRVDQDGTDVLLSFYKSQFWTRLPSQDRLLFTPLSLREDTVVPGMLLPQSIHQTEFGCLQILHTGPGLFLDDWLRNHPPSMITDAMALEFLKNLAAILDAAHGQGHHHGWIKPANIFLREGRLDQPLVLNWNQHLLRSKTLRMQRRLDSDCYFLPLEALKPEDQAPLMATDLYGLGMLLYFMLARSFPYTARDLETYKAQLLHRDALVPAHILPERWPSFMLMLGKMLRKLPEQRYQSAKGLLYDAQMVGPGNKGFPLGRRDPSRELPQHVHQVGQQETLNRLQRIWQVDATESSQVAVILGESGYGKSSLVDHLLQDASTASAIVHRRRLSKLERNQPYTALEGIVARLMQPYKDRSDDKVRGWLNHLKEDMGRDLPLILDRYASFRDIFLKHHPLPPAQQDLDFSTTRLNQLLAVFLKHLASLHGAFIFVIEELQWADSASLGVIKNLHHSRTRSLSKFLLIGTARQGESQSYGPLQELIAVLPDANRLVLKPLEPSESQILIESVLGEQSESVSRLGAYLHPLTQGIPFSILFSLKALHRSGALAQFGDADHWTILYEKLPCPSESPTLLDWAGMHIASLTAAARRVVSLLSVMGSRVSREDLSQVIFDLNLGHASSLGLKLNQLSVAIHELRDLDILKQLPGGELIFTHSSILEAGQALTSNKEKSLIHSSYAHVLMQKEGLDVETILHLADHLKLSTAIRNKSRARDVLVKAASYSESMQCYPEALVYWTHAFQLVDQEGSAGHTAERQEWLTIAERLAFHLGLAGRIEECMSIYERVLQLEKLPSRRARLYAEMSEYHLARFHYKASLDAAYAGLDELKIRGIRSEGLAWVTVLTLTVPLLLYVGGLSVFKQRKRVLPEDQADAYHMRLAVEVPLYFRQPIIAIANLFPLSFSLLRYKNHEVRQLLLCYWAVVFSQFDLAGPAFRCFSRASVYFQNHHHAIHKAFSLFVWGYTYEFLLDEIDRAELRVKDAKSIFESLGERFWRCLCLQALAHVDYFGKNDGSAAHIIPVLIENCDQLQAMSTPKNCAIKYYIAQNDFERARSIVTEIQRDLSDERHGDQLSLDTLFSHLSIGEYHFHLEQYDESERHLQKAFWLCFRHLHRVAYAILSPIYYARVLTIQGRGIRALGVLAFAWINQALKARIFFAPTCYATAEWLASIRCWGLARWFAAKGLQRAEQKQHRAMAAEGHACLAALWKERDRTRSDEHRHMAAKLYEAIEWPFFASQIRQEKSQASNRAASSAS